MVSYLILCRSLTYAQRTARILEREGVRGSVMRLPRAISTEGCGYCVKISEHWLVTALTALKREGMGPKQVYMEREDHTYSEVTT